MLILFEGLDFAGKETLAFMLVDELKKGGVKAEYSTRSLVKGLPRKFVDCVYTSEGLPSIFKTMIYGMVPFLDKLFFQQPLHWIIHETYIHRSIAYHRANKNYLFSELMNLCMPIFVKFDLIIYLTTDFDERVKRYSHSGQENTRDNNRFSRPEQFQNIHLNLEEFMAEQPNCVRFDTSGETPQQSFNRIWKFIEKKL